jgi:hypothetical protein
VQQYKTFKGNRKIKAVIINCKNKHSFVSEKVNAVTVSYHMDYKAMGILKMVNCKP